MEELTQKYFDVIKECQKVLAEWIVPDSTIDNRGVLSKLLGILDNRDLVTAMKGLPSEKELEFSKYWGAANIVRTKYYPKERVMEFEYTNGHIYQYYDVPLEIWNSSVTAVSIGSFMHRYIKGNFRYSRIN